MSEINHSAMQKIDRELLTMTKASADRAAGQQALSAQGPCRSFRP